MALPGDQAAEDREHLPPGGDPELRREVHGRHIRAVPLGVDRVIKVRDLVLGDAHHVDQVVVDGPGAGDVPVDPIFERVVQPRRVRVTAIGADTPGADAPGDRGGEHLAVQIVIQVEDGATMAAGIPGQPISQRDLPEGHIGGDVQRLGT